MPVSILIADDHGVMRAGLRALLEDEPGMQVVGAGLLLAALIFGYDLPIQQPLLFGVSLLVVFLVLAALYESWSVPFAVMLVVPLGVIGALIATLPISARMAEAGPPAMPTTREPAISAICPAICPTPISSSAPAEKCG